MKDIWTADVIEDPETGDYIMQITDEMNESLGWQVGDTLRWTDLKNGSWSLTKVDTDMEWVLVEAVQSYRMRYLVEVPKGKKEWAEDTVVMQEAKEFSQLDIGESILSSRVISYDEALALCKEDNDYISSWSDDIVAKNMFTSKSDYNGNKTTTTKKDEMGQETSWPFPNYK